MDNHDRMWCPRQKVQDPVTEQTKAVSDRCVCNVLVVFWSFRQDRNDFFSTEMFGVSGSMTDTPCALGVWKMESGYFVLGLCREICPRAGCLVLRSEDSLHSLGFNVAVVTLNVLI